MIQSIQVASEYANVFLDQVLGLPPSRDIDFTIDLIPGASLVSMAPYRIAPIELAELKKQIEELLEKQFIRPTASLWGALVLLVKKKDGSSQLCVDDDCLGLSSKFLVIQIWLKHVHMVWSLI